MAVSTVPATNEPAIESPEWWVQRLSRRLDLRLGLVPKTVQTVTMGRRGQGPAPIEPIDTWADYYDGRLNLALASEKWRSEFSNRFPAYSANFMAIVVDKHRERLQIQGIRYGDRPEADQDAWDWWQDNRMDSESLKLHREMLVKGSCNALVWPNEDGIPEISIESPNETIVETAPGKNWKRLAALKRFVGVDQRLHVELYLPDGIYRFRSTQRETDFSLPWAHVARWERDERRDEEWPIRNPLGIVPMVPFVHQPDLRNEGSSKIRPVASNQDAINKYRVDAFVAAEFASFRQRWAIGVDIPTDPATGQPVEPFKAAVDRLWVVPPPDPNDYPSGQEPKVAFGEFDVTPLQPFYDAITGEIKMLGTISKIPMHDLLPQSGQPASAEAIQSQESGLIAEVLDDMVNIGQSHEELFRLNFLMRNDPRGQVRGAEVIWADPETRSESQHIDALVKMRSLGIPDQALWEKVKGVTQSTIRRWRVMAATQQLEADATLPVIPPPAGPTNGSAGA